MRKNTRPETTKDTAFVRGEQYTGTYIGLVKDNRDSRRNGSLMVYVPEVSGTTPDDRNGWISAQYASPFAGATPLDFNGNDEKKYVDSQTSYGFWAVPPDINTRVLVTLVAGSAMRAFWFACVHENHSHQEVPGFGVKDPKGKKESFYDATSSEDIPLPISEYNKRNTKIDSEFYKENAPIQPYIAAGLRKTGLIHDEVRGTTTSSSMRENVSEVFGWSTPGPRITDPSADKEVYEVNGNSVTFDKSIKAPVYKSSTQKKLKTELDDNQEEYVRRKGGHSFVMDDKEGHEHIRLRTRSGAQLYIGETDGIIYINNRKGSAWIELGEDGNVDIYAAESISIRSQKDVNIRADRDVNIEAGRDLQLKAAKDYTESDIGEVKEEELQGEGGNIKIQANNDMHTQVENDQKSLVKGKQHEIVEKDVTRWYKENYEFKVDMNWYNTILKQFTSEVTEKYVVTSEEQITEKAPNIRLASTSLSASSSGTELNMTDNFGVSTGGTSAIQAGSTATMSASNVGLNGSKTALSGSIHLAGSVLAQQVQDTLDGNGAPNFIAAVVSPGASAVSNASTGSLVAEQNVEETKEAEEAETPQKYLKYNVEWNLKPEGNKVYSLSYEVKDIESIVTRFMTHEPCREHYNTGGVESRLTDYKTDRRDESSPK